MKTLLMIACLSLLAMTAVAQVDLYTSFSAGSFIQKGHAPNFGYWLGGEAQIPKFVDSARGLAVVGRVGVFTVDRSGGEIQGASVWSVTKKTLGIWNRHSLYGAIGGGFLYQVQEGDDQTQGALKLEIGLDLAGTFGISTGADIVPISGVADQYFVYLQFDLTPHL